MSRHFLSSLKNNSLLAPAAILIAALLVYAPSLNGQFLWDDAYLVGQNPFFKSPVFLIEVFRHYLFLDSPSTYYRPVQNLSYMLDYWLWNQNSFGYHLSNVFFHAASAFALYLLVKKLLPRMIETSAGQKAVPLFSILVSLTWVVHPVHNAGVAYVSGRADSLACLFAVSSWLLYIHATTLANIRGRIVVYLTAALLCLLGLCSKEIALIWIALFVTHAWLFAYQSRRNALALTASCVGLLIIYLLLRHLPSAAAESAPILVAQSWASRGILMLRALGDYASLMLFPADLHMDRILMPPAAYLSSDLWQRNVRFEYLSLLGGATIAAFAYLCLNRRPGQKIRLFGVSWFVLGFLPVSNLFPLNAQVAEHWIYMPSFGFLLFLGGCILAAPVRCQQALCYVTMLFTVGLGLRTALRSSDWCDAETFYKRTIADGGGTPRVHQNLAAAYGKRGDDASAEKILRESVQRFPDYPVGRINLGINLMKQGKTKEAEEYLVLTKADADAALHSRGWSAALNLAQMRFNAGQHLQALEVLDEAIAKNPEIWELVQFRAHILQKHEKLKDAVAGVADYAAKHWWHYESHLILGSLLNRDGQSGAALAAFEAAARLDIHRVEPLTQIAKIKLSQHQIGSAYETQLRAISRDPNQPSQFLFLAVILDELGRGKEAGRALDRAEDLRRAVNASLKVL